MAELHDVAVGVGDAAVVADREGLLLSTGRIAADHDSNAPLVHGIAAVV
jgi:hypothetical protein